MQQNAVMVTGGSGFIGQHLVRRLAEQGKTVVAVYHHKLPETHESIYPVCADITSPELLAAPLRGVDTVVHLAWDGGLAGPDGEVPDGPVTADQLTRNAKMTRFILTAMERAGTRRILFLSAIGAGRRADSAFLREKYLAETLVLNAKIPEKVILRSTVVWGGGQGASDPFLKTLIRVMRYPVFPLPKKLGGMAPMHVKDLAGILAAATDAPLAGEASLLDVRGGESYALVDLFKIVSDTYVKRTRIPLGGFLGQSLMPLVERDSRAVPRSPKLAQFLAIGGAGDESTRTANPLFDVVPKKLATFKEKILD